MSAYRFIFVFMERAKWIDRKFTFDFPIGWMPNILERLRGTPLRISDMTAWLPESTLMLKSGDAWSIKEHIGHLSDLEELNNGRIDDFLAGKDTLRAADMSNIKTRQANYNEKPLSELLETFTAMRQDLVARFEALDDQIQEARAMHPRLQVLMRPVDVAFFTAEHDDHHLASMRILLKDIQ